MPRSKLRSPASTWASGRSSFAATRAPASVELVSPEDDARVGRLADEDRLEAIEHRRPLPRVRAASDAELVGGCGQAQLAEERAGHAVVVVLAGIDEDRPVASAQVRPGGGGLDELRPGADDAGQPAAPDGD